MQRQSKDPKVASLRSGCHAESEITPNARADEFQSDGLSDIEPGGYDEIWTDDDGLPPPSVRPSKVLQSHVPHTPVSTIAKGRRSSRRRGKVNKKMSGKKKALKRNAPKQAPLASRGGSPSAGGKVVEIIDLVDDGSDEQAKAEQAAKAIPEKSFKKLSPDELRLIREEFVNVFPTPPSNMQCQGRYEAKHGRAMSEAMVQGLWESTLKPWSDRWWELYHDFNIIVRQKKLGKPRDEDPTIKKGELMVWAKNFYEEHDNPEPDL